MIRLCKTLLLAEVIRLFMSDDECCKHRPSFFGEDLLFFAEEFVIWKQWLRKNSQLVSHSDVSVSCPLSVPSAREVTSMTRGSGSWRRLCGVPGAAAQAAEPEQSSGCLWQYVTNSYFSTDSNISLLLHTALYIYLTLYLEWWLLTRSKKCDIIVSLFFVEVLFWLSGFQTCFIGTFNNQKDIVVLIFTCIWSGSS